MPLSRTLQLRLLPEPDQGAEPVGTLRIGAPEDPLTGLIMVLEVAEHLGEPYQILAARGKFRTTAETLVLEGRSGGVLLAAAPPAGSATPVAAAGIPGEHWAFSLHHGTAWLGSLCSGGRLQVGFQVARQEGTGIPSLLIRNLDGSLTAECKVWNAQGERADLSFRGELQLRSSRITLSGATETRIL
jgi:hypothetical protein